MNAVDPAVEKIVKRLISNIQWASIYLGNFEASNQFLRANSDRLDDDARQMLLMLDIGLPRLCALCLCRLWDNPGKDRHSLLALIQIDGFAAIAHERDASFVEDCKNLSADKLILELKRFRIVDLAHNLPIDRISPDGFKLDRLREALQLTHAIIDRLVRIMRMTDVRQEEIFQLKKIDGEQFWHLVSPRVLSRAGSED